MDLSFWTLNFPGNYKPKRKQNLICIFEESNCYNIHNKIVTFFMNRLIIDEDAAFECLGTCTLDYKGFVPLPLDPKSDKFLKIQNDAIQIFMLIDRAANNEAEEYDTHILFGSACYTSPDPQNI